MHVTMSWMEKLIIPRECLFFFFLVDLPSSRHEAKLEDSMDAANTQNSRAGTPHHPNMDLNTLASFLNSEDEWTS